MNSLEAVTRTSTWTALFSVASTLLAIPALHAQQTPIERPGITRLSSDHGQVAPQAQATVNVHLKLHSKAAFDSAVEALYTPGSPTYHRWMTSSARRAYAPTAAELASVKKELEAHGLTVAAVSGSALRASGTMSNLESAFQTQFHEFEHGGKTFYSNVSAARLAGGAGDLVSSVTGLSGVRLESHAKRATNPHTGKPVPAFPLSKAKSGFAGLITNNCFGPPFALELTTSGKLPTGVFFGNAYTQGETTCGWTPAQIRNHYDLDPAYKAKIDGTGQTIVLVEGPTDATAMQADLQTFDRLSGLPALPSSKLHVIYPDGRPSPKTGFFWQNETNLDLQWAHAIAPGASITVLIMPDNMLSSFEYAIQYATEHTLGNVISNSYGIAEYAIDRSTAAGFDEVIEDAAAAGIAVNFSTGDSGDDGTGAPNAGGASSPSDSPHATAVGGTSLNVPSVPKNYSDTGWGNNQTLLSISKTVLIDPPGNGGFVGGAGGGESIYFAKPAWQRSIIGKGRQQPDIAEVADPYTGVPIVLGNQIVIYGGTSLACPIFSAIWTMADERAGESLGQAAPLLTQLAARGNAIEDIVPVSTPTNVAGTIFNSSGAKFYSASALMAPLYTTTRFTSAFWEVPTAYGGGPGLYVDLSFGTDSSLQTSRGWDNVTGWGVPNGFTFINAAARLK
jgi:subtilase family serine protease